MIPPHTTKARSAVVLCQLGCRSSPSCQHSARPKPYTLESMFRSRASRYSLTSKAYKKEITYQPIPLTEAT